MSAETKRRILRRLVLALAAFSCLPVSGATNHLVRIGSERFDVGSDNGLRALQRSAAAPGTTHSSPKEQRGIKQIERLAGEAIQQTNPAARGEIEQSLKEVAAALRNNSRSPVPRHVDLLQLPFVHYRYVSASIGRGKNPAANLQPGDEEPDLSRVDPLPSTFWSRPTKIAAQDLSTGFGRQKRPRFEDELWTYAAPKTSYGGHAGFEARSEIGEVKIKFGEVHSEPFTARIFHALGYNVEPVDFSPGLKIRYDRRLLTEFNSRKAVDTKITALGILPVWTIHFQPRHNPFDFIAAAAMKDGRRVSPAALKTLLACGAAGPQSSAASGGFDTNFESQIDYLITVPANVQLKDPNEKSIGPWDFGQLGHADRRELRGAGLLAAWLGWFDSRFDNTRLRVVKNGDGPELKHVFADLGGGLGHGSAWSGWRAEKSDDFPDFFTEPEVRPGKGRMTIPFRVVNFRPIESTPAFREMTVDDARWMARLIAQLTEKQIAGALQASGFSESDARVFGDKLLKRRKRMCEDLAEQPETDPIPPEAAAKR